MSDLLSVGKAMPCLLSALQPFRWMTDSRHSSLFCRPFLLDLESANGTTVNQKEVPASRYYELRNGDTVRFAASEREWVLLCEDM